MESDKIKSLIEVRRTSVKEKKVKILILGSLSSSTIIIKNLFNKNFMKDDLKLMELETKSFEISENVEIFYGENISKLTGLKDVNFDCILCGISLINKRVNFEELKKMDENSILILTDIESLDLRELREMEQAIKEVNNNFNVMTVTDIKLDSIHNQWSVLPIKIEKHLDANKRLSFMKSQLINNSFRDKMCDEIIEFYINIFDDMDIETLNESDIIYIQTNMLNEILNLYSHTDEIDKEIVNLIESNVEKMITIKRNKIEERLKIEAKERQIKSIKQKERKEQKEQIKQQERNLIELKKLEKERIILNEKIKELNEKLKENPFTDKNLNIDNIIDDIIIEANFLVDNLVNNIVDNIEVNNKQLTNKIENKGLVCQGKNSQALSKIDTNRQLIIKNMQLISKNEDIEIINEIEARIDNIIYNVIASKIEELVGDVRDEIKEKINRFIGDNYYGR